MNKLSLADIHCDTALEMFKKGERFYDNSLSVSSRLAEVYENYIQVIAIWSDKRLDNDGAYKQFFDVLEHLKGCVETDSSVAFFDGKSFPAKNNLILSVEDARILNGDMSRLVELHKARVRILTLLWSGHTCIGGGFDTDEGLTDFGKDVIRRCIELEIIPDISHASRKSADDILDICQGKIPVVASHSDSYSVCSHPRNLTDKQLERIMNAGGLVGINLCKAHLGEDLSAIDQIMRHIEQYLELGGEDAVCFGCDFDGAQTPDEIQDISSLYLVAEEMQKRHYDHELINKIFYSNVKDFILKYIKG